MNSQISLYELLNVAFRQKWRVAVAFLTPLLIAAVLLFYLTPIYSANVSLVVKPGRVYATMGEHSVGAPTSTLQEAINSEIHILTNRAVVGETIDRIGLAKLYPDIAAHSDTLEARRDAAIDIFEKALTAQAVKLASVIDVTFKHPDKAVAKPTLDTLVNVYEDVHLKIYAGRGAKAYEQNIAQDLSSVVPVQASVVGTKPVFPKKSIFLAIGILAGLGLSGGVVVAAFCARNTFMTAETVERALGVRVIASVPDLETSLNPLRPAFGADPAAPIDRLS